MKRILFYAFLSTLSPALSAQTISFEFPYHPGAKLSLTLKYGISADTVFIAELDALGKAKVTAAPSWKDYRGMAKLAVEGGGSLDFVVAGEDNTVIRCEDEYPHGGNTVFENSPENRNLQSSFVSQYLRHSKLGLLNETARLYSSEDNGSLVADGENNETFRSLLASELERLQARQHDFERELLESPFYSAKFIRYYNYLHNEIDGLAMADASKRARVRNFVRDSLDVNGLFTSGLWFDTLNGLLALYDNGSPYHKSFIDDMSMLLDRAENERTYNTLAENLFAICESTGWNDLEEQLAYGLINGGRIQNPTGRLKMLVTLFKLGKGGLAPALSQAEAKTFGGKTLLVFHESGCNACQNELWQLKAHYPPIKDKGYEIVSVSADTDAKTFADTANDLPWENKFCDLKGFGGDDFKNYGVIGTPTFYLIDENGVVTGRHARLADTGLIE